jgi:hypothetical protein
MMNIHMLQLMAIKNTSAISGELGGWSPQGTSGGWHSSKRILWFSKIPVLKRHNRDELSSQVILRAISLFICVSAWIFNYAQQRDRVESTGVHAYSTAD